jgi:uncharacterized membrane protein YraQ (UPF0718 family)
MSFIKTEWKKILVFIGAFLAIYHLPVENAQFNNAVLNSISSINTYFRDMFLFGLFPAMFIAGAISTFLRSNTIIKYMGSKAKKPVAYSFASISGFILTVCSCSAMPLFAGIHKMGAGLGPAITFLFAAPAINLVAITLTSSVLGIQIGIARTASAVIFSFFIGLFMAFIFRKGELQRDEIAQANNIEDENTQRPFKINIIFIGSMLTLFILSKLYTRSIFLLVFMIIVAVFFFFLLIKFYEKNDFENWFSSTFDFIKKILPLLTIGIFISSFLLGFDGKEGIIPTVYINTLVGGNSLRANFITSFFGAFIYFCTLIEVPIVQGFMNSGMGKGPALALLLAGPAVSLPNMLIVRSVIGTKKTIVYMCTVIIFATLIGYIFGNFF